MFKEQEKFNDKTLDAFKISIYRGWLTRQYFTRGKHDLVLPAWLLGLIGPDGEGNHGIAGSLELTNTDLRSYYALGSPRSDEEPVIDHRGGIIPSPYSYTILFGTVIENRPFYSSEVGEVTIDYTDAIPTVTVYWEVEGDTMVYDVCSDRDEDGNEAVGISVVRGFANHPLLVTVIPMDQDGITNIPQLSYDSKEKLVSFGNNLPPIRLNEVPIRVTALPIAKGHAGRLVVESSHDSGSVDCKAGLASWAAQFPVRSTPVLTVVLDGDPPEYFPDFDDIRFDWEDLIEERFPEITTSDDEADYYFKASAIVLRLLADMSKKEITVGPSVQEDMWLPALYFQARALDRLGFAEEIVEPILNEVYHFIDSNGLVEKDRQYDSQGTVVIAMINHFYRTWDTNFIGEKYSGIKRVAEWIFRQRKKNEEEEESSPELQGLLPPGNASWFNPLYWKLDYYYSHNFWASATLENMIKLSTILGRHADAEKYEPELEKYKQNIDDSITTVTSNLNYLPAGPFQRDNASMIFNLVAYYPLKQYSPAFQALNNTLQWLWNNYTHNGGILIDAPWNAYGSYFSMFMAQAWRYVGDAVNVERVIDFLLNNVTNKSGWAEGISPLTRLGSVGDSPNGFAAAEFVNLILDMFAEDFSDKPPVMLKGMPIAWLKAGVSAKGLQLFYNSTLDVEAKLNGDIFEITWDYQNQISEHLPVLFVPYPLKSPHPDLEQLSTNEYQLLNPSGTLKLELEV